MVKKVMKINPCNNNIGAEIELDLSKNIKEKIKEIKKTLHKYGLVFFRNQKLDPAQYMKFAENFGNFRTFCEISTNFPDFLQNSLRFHQNFGNSAR